MTICKAKGGCTKQANYYFTGVIMKPGKYKVKFYFDNSNYRFGIYISIIFMMIIGLSYNFNYFNLRKWYLNKIFDSWNINIIMCVK